MQLAVDHEGGDKERERPGKRKRACQVQRARGEQHSTAGEVEHERVKLQYALGGLLLIEVGLPLALEGGLRLRQRLVGRGERTQHRHPAGILDHRIRHVLLSRRHLAGDRRRTPSQPLEDDEPDRDSHECDGRHRRRERQEEQAHGDGHGDAARQARHADGHELLELVDGRGERGRDGGEPLLGEISHGRALQLVAHPQAQVAEHMEALRVHLDVDEVLEHELARHAHDEHAEALQGDLSVQTVAVLERPPHRCKHARHEEGLEDVAGHPDDEAAPG